MFGNTQSGWGTTVLPWARPPRRKERALANQKQRAFALHIVYHTTPHHTTPRHSSQSYDV